MQTIIKIAGSYRFYSQQTRQHYFGVRKISDVKKVWRKKGLTKKKFDILPESQTSQTFFTSNYFRYTVFFIFLIFLFLIF